MVFPNKMTLPFTNFDRIYVVFILLWIMKIVVVVILIIIIIIRRRIKKIIIMIIIDYNKFQGVFS